MFQQLLILYVSGDMSPNEGWVHLYGFLYCRYLVICHPVKAKYISTPGRAKKIIATIWMAAISMSSVVVPFVTRVSMERVK